MYEELIRKLLAIARWYSMPAEHKEVIDEVIDILEKGNAND